MKVVRILAAVVGGYTLTAALCHWLEKLLNLADRDEQLLTNIVFFLIYLVLLMVLFCGNNHRKIILTTVAANTAVWLPWILVAEGGV